MSEVAVGNFGKFGARRPTMFKTDHRLRDALADYFAEQYPVGRRSLVAKRFKLTNDEARAVCDGSASPTTLDKVWRKGGWGLVIAVFTRLLGEGLDQHLERERRHLAEHDQKLGAMVSDLRVAGGLDRHPAYRVAGEDRRLAPVHDRRGGQRAAARTADD